MRGTLGTSLLRRGDQQKVTNAYVSGTVQEDLGLHGNELNYVTIAWTCGHAVGQIPATMLITRIRPSIWIPLTELVWSILTIILASSKNFNTLVAIRFLMGLAESSFYPTMQYVTGSWYKPEELGKRECIIEMATAVGPMVSGFLQAGAYSGLDGKYGLASWRWLFIIDGIITVPIALLGFFIMPDSNTKPNYLYTQAEVDLANRRMEELCRKPPEKFTKEKIMKFFTSWHLYLFTLLYILFSNGSNPSSSMISWLKSFNTPEKTVYTVAQINTYPLPIYAVQIVSTFAYPWWSDAVRARWPHLVLAGLWSMAVSIVLAATPLYTHTTRRWVFYYMTSVCGGLAGLISSWANELTGHDSEKRAFVIACCNAFSLVIQAWFPTVLFPQVEQPRVFKGNIATACVNFSMVCMVLTVLALSRRDARKKARAEAQNQDIPVTLSASGSSEDAKFEEDGRAMVELNVVEELRR
ncbi:hypothetical protein FOMPIDRAFT_1044797 [Fomitopsis schrenkii]|uniref:Major facilitator superfamily (MFS) profile domain-containing protein n=1 Tax=Fomitopsis schrenkii TaxID=2126942 RepID=S8EJY7_FOMSC|nr:hypothetical protein FOMPIDRAFT_1044797 [Fomitopsis schrenkii]